MKSKSIRKICLVAVFAAIIAALSLISIPTPFGLAVTLQTFAVAVSAFALGRAGTAATVSYVLLGVAGLPVFSGFSGGPGVLLGASGGFIWAFPSFAFILSLAVYVNKALSKAAVCLMALIILYFAGILQFMFITSTPAKTAVVAFALYFAKDILSVGAAYFLCVRIRPATLKFMQLK